MSRLYSIKLRGHTIDVVEDLAVCEAGIGGQPARSIAVLAWRGRHWPGSGAA